MSTLLDEAVDIEKLIFEAEHLVERRNPEALPLAEQAMQLAVHSGNPKHIAYATYILAFYHCLVGNNYDLAIDLCNNALEKLGVENISDINYKIYMTLGNSYQLRGEIFSAQESYMKGLTQLESLSELSKKQKAFIASFYYNVSLVLSSAELGMTSEEYILKAIDIYQKIDDGFKLSKCYVAYAGVFENKGEYQKAIEIVSKALEIDERINDPYSIALSKANLGILHLRVQKYDEAFAYLHDALEYYNTSHMLYETAMVKMNIGETLFAVDRKTEGIRELQEAEILFEKLENKRELSHVYQLLSDFIATTDDYKTAFSYQRKYAESLKHFFNIEKTNALTRAKKEFETEQKEKEAVLQKEKNEEIKRYVNKLEVSNNELKQFAQVASHDLREPLRMVNSYLNLLKRSLNDNLTLQQSEFIEFAQDGAKRMDQLIMDLLRLAKVDANLQINHLSLQNILDEVKLNLGALVKDRNALIIAIELPHIIADRTQMIQLFQNLIANGIKYNISQQPVIKITSKVENGNIEITVADNGIGIQEDNREKVFQIFQRLHSSHETTGTGIGLAICKKIVGGMNGKIFIEDNPRGGSVFKITFPENILSTSKV